MNLFRSSSFPRSGTYVLRYIAICIVPTLRRGNAGVDAPASRNAEAVRTEFPRRSVGTIKGAPYANACRACRDDVLRIFVYKNERSSVEVQSGPPQQCGNAI